MVLSKINGEISYPELKSIDENDKGRNVSMYQVNLLKISVVIALGEIKYTYVGQNILFAPVYLVVNEHNKIYQIGVYEFNSKHLENLKDEDGDLDISLIEGPLMYSFLNGPYIKKCMKNETLVSDHDSDDNESDNEPDKESDKKEDDLFNPPPVLVELSIEDDDDDFLQKGEEDDKKEQKYEKSVPSASSWIEHFMNNNNYGIQDNPGHGDCFFYTIRDAFISVGVDASVKKIRDTLVKNVDKTVINNYKERYDMLLDETKSLNQEISTVNKRIPQLVKEFNNKNTQAKSEKDIPTKKKKKKKIKEIINTHSKLLVERKRKKGELKEANLNFDQVKWFESVKNLEQLKTEMKTDHFWADAWAISTLELILNVKFIILSSDEYKIGKYGTVLKCGDFVPKKIEDKTYFKPKYYIMVEHTGNHYKLITYKGKKIYRFHDIPYGMKSRIIEKCMKSKGKSLYNYIPKFAKLIGETIVVGEVAEEVVGVAEEVVEEVVEEVNEDVLGKEEAKGTEGEAVKSTPTPEDQNLFDDSTVFFFYSLLARKPPRKGKGKTISEKIRDEDIPKYKDLGKIKDWRRVLSNMYVKPKVNDKVSTLFELDGLKWASVEHYYHANKFKKNNPDYYRLFSIDSGSEIMADPLKALGAGGKTGKIKGKKFRPSNVVMDEDFFDGKNREIIMESGQKAKYEQDDLSRRVLLATKEAKLVHYISSRGGQKENIVFYDTMRIRKELKKRN